MITLHHGIKGDQGNIEKQVFDTFQDLRNWVEWNIVEQDDKETVYLLSHRYGEDENGEVYITERASVMLAILSSVEPVLCKIRIQADIFIFEEESFEDAYAIALDVKEESALCYSK